MEQIQLAEITVKINQSLTMLETLRVKRAAVDNIVKEQRESIDKRVKEVKAVISVAVKAMDVATACAVATSLSASPYKADDTERQRNQRRRTWLITELSSAFPTYDIVNTKGVLSASYIGDKSVREAKEIFSRLRELAQIGITSDSSLEDIKAKLSVNYTQAVTADDGMESTNDMLAAIAAKVTGQVVNKAEEAKVSQA